MITGNIFNIQRFCTHDGPGIRTVVFFKGCPLSCVWCHNPESKNPKPQIMYDFQKCLNCGLCANVCTEGVHVWHNSIHIIEREKCTVCGKCSDICPSDALELCGKSISAEEIVETALRDSEFYKESGGGITLSGGEPLMQYDFAMEILKLSRENGLHTAIETSGYCTRDLTDIAQFTDLWLYDIKHSQKEKHLKYTGVSNDIILKNLRCPIIPDINLNSEHFEYICNLANSHKSVEGVETEPYHPLGIQKSIQLGKKQAYTNEDFLAKKEIEPFIKQIRHNLRVNII